MNTIIMIFSHRMLSTSNFEKTVEDCGKEARNLTHAYTLCIKYNKTIKEAYFPSN